MIQEKVRKTKHQVECKEMLVEFAAMRKAVTNNKLACSEKDNLNCLFLWLVRMRSKLSNNSMDVRGS